MWLIWRIESKCHPLENILDKISDFFLKVLFKSDNKPFEGVQNASVKKKPVYFHE